MKLSLNNPLITTLTEVDPIPLNKNIKVADFEECLKLNKEKGEQILFENGIKKSVSSLIDMLDNNQVFWGSFKFIESEGRIEMIK